MGWVRLFVLFGHGFLDLFRSRASLEAERLVLARYCVALAPGRIPVDMAPKATAGRATVTGESSSGAHSLDQYQ